MLCPPYDSLPAVVDFFQNDPLFADSSCHIGLSAAESPQRIFEGGTGPQEAPEFAALRRRYLDLARSGELYNPRHPEDHRVLHMLFDNVFLDLYRARRGKFDLRKASPGGICMPAQRRLYARSDGRFFPCERVPEYDIFCVGNYLDGVDVAKAYSLCASYVGMTPEACKNCWALLLCDMNCFRDAFDEHGPSPQRKAKACEALRRHKSRLLSEMLYVLEGKANGLQHLDAYVTR